MLAYSVPISGDKNKVAPSATLLRRGGNTTLAVRVIRRYGFDGDVEISVDGLPDGVICHGALASGKVDQVSLVISALENTTPWSGPIHVIGKAKIGDREINRLARGSAFIWGTQNAQQQ